MAKQPEEETAVPSFAVREPAACGGDSGREAANSGLYHNSQNVFFLKEDVEPENAAIGGLQSPKLHFEDSSFGRQPRSLSLPESEVFTHRQKNKPKSVPKA